MSEVKTTRFIFSAAPSLLAEVDDWRGKQPGVPTRAEAVRRLLAQALAMEKTKKLIAAHNFRDEAISAREAGRRARK